MSELSGIHVFPSPVVGRGTKGGKGKRWVWLWVARRCWALGEFGWELGLCSCSPLQELRRQPVCPQEPCPETVLSL